MRTYRNRATTVLAAVIVFAGANATSRAQFFIGAGDYDRGLQPGAVIPHDGLPFSHRYGFFAGSGPFFGANYNQMEYLDYLDRLDRAERFGYRIPTPPAFLISPACRPCARETPPSLYVPVR